MTCLKIIIMCMALVTLAALAFAGVPQTINYQGYLTDKTGVPVTVPAKTIGFALYSTMSGTKQLWNESQDVKIDKGIYSVVLGSITPITLPFDTQYYLSITITPDPEMTPRQALTNAPYAIRAGCSPGDMLSCYTGPAGTLDVGVCKSGMRTCKADGSSFGPCLGEILPSREIRDGKDNDCNGLIDDGAPLCNPGDTQSCGSSIGACRPGIATCSADGSAYGPCEGATGPAQEVCDGMDNDCNGIVDDNITYPPVTNAQYACINGETHFFCNPGYSSCATSGLCETNTANDPQNCGGCGVACSSPNASSYCQGGMCGISMCNAGFANCNQMSADGCEVNTQSDVNNCGGCGVVCPVVANGSRSCQASVCTISSCNSGYANCDGAMSNGCEANITSDPNNCGACGTVCPSVANGTRSCSFGGCGIASCNAGFSNCNMLSADGCEINTANDPQNCGGCGVACLLPNASSYCQGGMCGISMCNAGFANCNQMSADGCEVNTQSDVNNCGGCGVVCPSVANGTRSCSFGVCGIASCNAGFSNCNMVSADGCEINTANNAYNCGACYNVCTLANAIPYCQGGACGISSCISGYGDCDGNPANGCETNLNTSAANCGTCGRVCASGVCSNGTCL